jgi:hypothetical protein
MAADVTKIAKLLGAQIVAQVPHTGGGAFGAARLAHIITTLQARLTPGQGKRPGRPSVVTWTVTPKVPMSAETEAKLARLAAQASTSERKVSPMQLAAQLLEEALANLPDE